jgi:hypothetical protein
MEWRHYISDKKFGYKALVYALSSISKVFKSSINPVFGSAQQIFYLNSKRNLLSNR